MYRDFRIVIPTKDSASWLGIILDWYQQNKFEPLFIVDSRTKDSTRDLPPKGGPVEC
jgi:hypothetical protein